MSEFEVLKQMGLTEAEAKIYLTLLELGSSLAGPIILKTGLHRGTTYQILQRLIDKGLVNFVIKSKKRYFDAVSPNKFLDILKEKEESLNNILPLLLQKKESNKDKQEVKVFVGYNGIKTVCESMLNDLKDGGEYFDFGVSGLFRDVMGPYWELLQKRKKRLKIKAKCIFDKSLKNSNLLKDYFGEARFYSSEFQSLTDTIIYSDKVILFIWTAKPPIAIVIDNQENARSYSNQFKLMWKNSDK